MRTLIVALAASAAVVCILSSFAQQTSTSNDKSAAKEPTSDQLLTVPVGGYVIGGAAPPVANPYEGNKEAIARGRQLFDAMNCSGCHAPEAGGGMGTAVGRRGLDLRQPARRYLSHHQAGSAQRHAFVPGLTERGDLAVDGLREQLERESKELEPA
jgi:cytochrome c oxidase cbb3-type subunit 3